MNKPTFESAILEQTGEVVAIEGHYAVIETQQRSACGHCNVGGSCGTSLLAEWFSKHKNQVRLFNNLNLSVGDRAVIGIYESVLLRTAVMSYLVPLAMMISFAIVSNWAGVSDGMSCSISLLGLFLGMMIIHRIMRKKDHQASEIVLLRNANKSVIQFTDRHTGTYLKVPKDF